MLCNAIGEHHIITPTLHECLRENGVSNEELWPHITVRSRPSSLPNPLALSPSRFVQLYIDCHI